MIVFAWLFLGGAAIIAVLVPFLKAEKPEPKRSRALAFDGAKAPGIVNELDSDYRTGILSKDEYDALRSEYAASGRAGQAPPADERLKQDDDIERRVRELRERKAAVTPFTSRAQQTKPAVQQASKGQKKQLCPKCGQPYKQSDRFCTECGTRLNRGGG